MSQFGWKLAMSGVLVLPACKSDPADDTAGSSGSSDSSGSSGGSQGSSSDSDSDPTGGTNEDAVALRVNKDVDILFVIDNSGSMAEEQALLSANFAAFLGVLEAPDVALNYRIGVTTTDAGNPRCPNSAPENGTLVLSSCRDRAAEFSFNGEDFSFACTDFCAKQDAALQVKPTTTQYDDAPAPRKWIERTEGQSNIGGVASNTEAFQCYGPQGVTGCGFESHLESMYKALAKAADKGSMANYGFLRDAAVLSIVMVSDETDCSYSQAGKDIFIGNKVFWNSPDDPQPTSALCWRAGVECSGGGPTYDGCYAANWGADGQAGASDADAVLKPVYEYISFLKNIEAQKQNINSDQWVLVSLIGGVPMGYEDGAELVYEDSPDPDYQASFGIGPGCVGGSGATAVPPVREREFAEAFAFDDERSLYSICQPDYSGALQSIAQRIRAQIRPICMPNCVNDTEPESPDTLEPLCQLYEVNLDDSRTGIAACEAVGGEWALPAGQTVCFAMRTDKGSATPSAIDDMSTMCIDYGYNLEFVLLRAGPAPAGTTIAAECELSANKKKDCPDL